jgi:FtsZ-interacting cell division protein ZipA
MPDATPAGSAPKKVTRRRGGGFLNLLLLVGIIVTIALFVWAEQQRREAQQKLSQTAGELEELRKSAQASGQEVADEVLGKLRQHMEIPTDPQPTVATIVDAAALKESNEFYQPAENGDHLVITAKRAILYDADRDIILDVVPVSIDESQQAAADQANQTPDPNASPLPSPAGSPAASPSPATTPVQ